MSRAIEDRLNDAAGDPPYPGRSKQTIRIPSSAHRSSADEVSSREDGVPWKYTTGLPSGSPACRTARAPPPTSYRPSSTHPATMAGV